MKTTVKLNGGRIEINLGSSSIALSANHENAKLANEICTSLNEHAALVAVAEAAAKFVTACPNGDLQSCEGLEKYHTHKALANLAAMREGGAK